MLVVIPLGALPLALLFDLAALAARQLSWLDAAFGATAIATLGIAAAALPGFVDYRSVVPATGPVRRIARQHLWLGVASLLVALASALAHWSAVQDPTILGVDGATGLNVLGVLMLLGQGWLGGELVYRGRVGVLDEAEAEEPAREAARVRRGTEERGRKSV
jgi:uncharacterized membrane protein